MKFILTILMFLTSALQVQAAPSLYDLSVKRIDGTPIKLAEYKGKVLLIVNVASECGLTSQYEGLEKIYEKYQPKGLEILAFPANQFMGQEPGTNAEIKEFCRTKYGVKFPMFEKIVVKGEGQHPLYAWLTSTKPETTMKPDGTLIGRLMSKNLISKAQDIHWNFEKFLINRKGEIVERFSPELEPQDPIIIKALEKTLN